MSLFRNNNKKNKKAKGFNQRLKTSAFTNNAIKTAMEKTHKIISADITDASYLKYILSMQYALHTLDDLKSNLNKLDEGIYEDSIKNMFRNKEHSSKWKTSLNKLIELETQKFKITKDLIDMLDREYMTNEHVENFYNNIAADNNSDLLMNNIDLYDRFFQKLVTTSNQKRIEDIMEGLSKETTNRQYIVRSDEHIFYVRYLGKQEYFTANIPSLKDLIHKAIVPIDEILVFDPEKGRTIKVTKKNLKKIYEGTEKDSNWIDEKLKLIK